MFGHRKVPSASAQIAQHQPLYVVVFGYPADKYSVTVEYFKSLGDATDVEHSSEITNCFRIGYRDPGDAMRAVRKNGEVLGGSWMVGAKWAVRSETCILLYGKANDKSRTQHKQKLYLDSRSPE